MRRGDVVLVDLRPADPNAKVRPALVVQNDRDNARMTNTVVAGITSVTHRAGEPTQLLIDPTHPDWTASGLHYPSTINCSNLFTVKQLHIIRVLGTLSAGSMQQIAGCLKTALAVP